MGTCTYIFFFSFLLLSLLLLLLLWGCWLWADYCTVLRIVWLWTICQGRVFDRVSVLSFLSGPELPVVPISFARVCVPSYELFLFVVLFVWWWRRCVSFLKTPFAWCLGGSVKFSQRRFALFLPKNFVLNSNCDPAFSFSFYLPITMYTHCWRSEFLPFSLPKRNSFVTVPDF